MYNLYKQSPFLSPCAYFLMYIAVCVYNRSTSLCMLCCNVLLAFRFQIHIKMKTKTITPFNPIFFAITGIYHEV